MQCAMYWELLASPNVHRHIAGIMIKNTVYAIYTRCIVNANIANFLQKYINFLIFYVI